ncbi:MAG: cobalt ECF transporter T component CbiQ [Nitrospiraceae bacterium]|nr:MAG: cobalt ECF transporter T component CbiQ [Nitrospiraceae bacterium]
MAQCECFSEHFSKRHFLSGIDARVKLLVTLALLLMVLSYQGILFPILVSCGAFMLCAKMRIPVKMLFMRMAQPLFLAVVVLVLKCFFTGEDMLFVFSLPTSHFPLLTLAGHSDGLLEGLRITSRIMGGVSLVIALGFATPFIEFVAALSWLRVPRPFIEIMMFAYRYLFVFLEDASTIYSAQKNRLGYAGLRRGLNSFGVLTGSLVLRGFEQSQKTADAMIQRGYTGDMPLLKSRPLKAAELAVAFIVVVIGGAVWMI